jgi:hypothetical protein
MGLFMSQQVGDICMGELGSAKVLRSGHDWYCFLMALPLSSLQFLTE